MKEASQVWLSAAKYILTVAEDSLEIHKSSSHVTTAVFSNYGSLQWYGSLMSLQTRVCHQAAESTAP